MLLQDMIIAGAIVASAIYCILLRRGWTAAALERMLVCIGIVGMQSSLNKLIETYCTSDLYRFFLSLFLLVGALGSLFTFALEIPIRRIGRALLSPGLLLAALGRGARAAARQVAVGARAAVVHALTHPFFGVSIVLLVAWLALVATLFGMELDSAFKFFSALYIVVGFATGIRQGFRPRVLAGVWIGIGVTTAIFVGVHELGLFSRAGSVLLLNASTFCFLQAYLFTPPDSMAAESDCSSGASPISANRSRSSARVLA